MKTKIISVITLVCLLFSAMSVFASAAGERGMISLDSVSAKVGEKITVPVKMEQNPGILAIIFGVTYDKDVLSFDSVNYSGKLFSKDEIDVNSSLTGEVVFSLVTSGLTNNVTGTGNLFDIIFTVNKEAANGTYPITANITKQGNMSGQAVNAAEQLVDFEFTNATVTVSGGKDAPKTTAAPKTQAVQQNATVESVVSYVQTEAGGQPVTDKDGQSVTATSKVYVAAGTPAASDNASGEQLSNVPNIADSTNGSNGTNSSNNSGPNFGAIVGIILLAAAIILCVVAVIITKKRNAANADNTSDAGNATAQNAPEAQPTETNSEDSADSDNTDNKE